MISPINFFVANAALFTTLATAIPTLSARSSIQNSTRVMNHFTVPPNTAGQALWIRDCTYTGDTAKIMAAGGTMATGDPNETNQSDSWGYRKELEKLMGVQARINYVGTQHKGTAQYVQTYEGYAYQTIPVIRSKVVSALSSTSPDGIILTAGTADVMSSNSADYLQAPTRMDAFLGDIFSWNKDVVVVLSALPRINDGAGQEKATKVNANYANLVSKYAKQGRHILYADVSGTLDSGDLITSGLPSPDGFKKLASVYASSLQKAVCNGWFNH